MLKLIYSSVCLLIFSVAMRSQSNSIFTDEMPQVRIKKTSSKITLDGKLDEPVWSSGVQINNFTQYSPTDSLAAISPTEVYICYDEDHIYVASKCKIIGDQLVVQTLKRDYGFSASDNITFLFDTFNDKTNALVFGINPLGVRREASINNGGRDFRNFNFSWDNKWEGHAFIGDGYWTSEIAIPFSTLRFNKGSEVWRFNCYRNDTQANEITSWIQIPDNNNLADVTFMGEIHWEEPLENTSSNVSIIPYASGSITRDFENIEQLEANIDGNIGGDAKIAITSGMNLDLTINPDFSQVEVDRQVTNLDRFEIFFPERRQFFIENADLFSKFGTQRINPFFSRRIGVAVDTTEDANIQQNTIYGGLRLSGKLNDDLRVGLINMQTASDADIDLPSYNYSVFALEQQVFDRSSVAFAFINKQAHNYENYEDSNDAYNRVGALEYRLATYDNVWSGKISYQQAFTTTEATDKFAQFVNLTYNKKRIRLDWTQSYIGNGFDAQLGFVPRKDILTLSPSVRLNFYPANNNIRQSNLSFEFDWIYKLGEEENEIVSEFSNVEKNIEVEYSVQFVSGERISIESDFGELILLDDFDPTRIQADDIFLSAGERFKNYSLEFNFNSDRRKNLNGSFRPIVGKFFSGLRAGFRSNLNYRVQPYATFGLAVNYNHIDIGRNFETANLWLIGPRIDLTFSKSLFLSTFIQYNSQIDNLNINTRFQWRFAPVSDFFLVYTDNYLAEDFGQLSSTARGVVAKFTYWINL